MNVVGFQKTKALFSNNQVDLWQMAWYRSQIKLSHAADKDSVSQLVVVGFDKQLLVGLLGQLRLKLLVIEPPSAHCVQVVGVTGAIAIGQDKGHILTGLLRCQKRRAQFLEHREV